MSIKISQQVWEDHLLTGTQLLLMLALADNADEKTRQCFPSIDYLAAKTRKSRRNVQDTIQDLISDAKLTVALNAGPSGTNVYTLFPVFDGGVQELHPCNPAAENRTENRRQTAPEPSGTVRNRQEPSGTKSTDLPEDLKAIPEVVRAWDDWKQHCKEKRKNIGPLAASKQFSRIRKWGPSKWIAAVNYSIEQNWSGIYEEPYKNNHSTIGRSLLEGRNSKNHLGHNF